jgi:hypothetical protein
MKTLGGAPVTDEEFDIAQTIQLGTVDDEIRLTRILLRRMLREERASTSSRAARDIRPFDFDDALELIARIEALELARLHQRLRVRLLQGDSTCH